MPKKSASLTQKRKTMLTLLMGVVGGIILSWVINNIIEMNTSPSTETETFSSPLLSLFLFFFIRVGVPILTIFATGYYLLPVLGHIYRKYNGILAFILIAIILLLACVFLYIMFVAYLIFLFILSTSTRGSKK